MKVKYKPQLSVQSIKILEMLLSWIVGETSW